MAARSRRTSGSAFSLRANAAEVCCISRCSNPVRGQRWQLPQDFGGYKVDAARIGAQSDMGLFYHDS